MSKDDRFCCRYTTHHPPSMCMLGVEFNSMGISFSIVLLGFIIDTYMHVPRECEWGVWPRVIEYANGLVSSAPLYRSSSSRGNSRERNMGQPGWVSVCTAEIKYWESPLADKSGTAPLLLTDMGQHPRDNLGEGALE